ncbi:MAG: hypothetical protein VW338_17190 [Rhodospirillaceae bacterium]
MKGVSLRAGKFVVWRAHKELSESLGRDPSVFEIAAHAGLPTRYTARVLETLTSIRARDEREDETMDVVDFMKRAA